MKNKIPLKQLQSKSREYASVVLLRVKLAMEESNLRKCFTRLGKMFHGAVCTENLEEFKETPAVVELLGEIEERRRSINALKEQIENWKF